MSYPIGYQFIRMGGARRKRQVETITDVLTTTNLAGDVVKTRYVATHEFCGQTITDCDVIPTTIDRANTP